MDLRFKLGRRTDDLPQSLPDPHTLSTQEALDRLQSSPKTGLSIAEVRSRRRRFGPNRLRESKPKSATHILYDQLESLIVLLLGVAACLSFLFERWVEGFAIIVVILINTAIGFFTELRAVRSMEALRRLSIVLAKVRRDGQVVEVPAQKLVPGDIVLVEGGDIVSADLRLIEASKLQCDESVLTGESLPIVKRIDPLPQAVPLPDRVNMAFQGTAVTRGTGEGIVVATGMATELGRIASLVEETEETETPLERRIDHLSRQLVWATLGLTAVIGVVGILTGKPPLLMIETAIALAVAAVPEGLPMVATLALARGMWRMARRNALIERLSAVETLGATTIILTDKTGTMTENRMTVTHIALPSGDVSVATSSVPSGSAFVRDGIPLDPSDDDVLRQLLDVSVLCNDATLSRDPDHPDEIMIVGDPMEGALLVLGAKAGIERQDLLKARPEVREEAFDPDLKMMATVHRTSAGYFVAVKGAPEALLDRVSYVASALGAKSISEAERSAWHEKSITLANRGLRVLAVAAKTTEKIDEPVYRGLTFLGLIGLYDPPRGDVADAIAACKRAGIRVVMVTGDHAVTAQQVAAAVGLPDRDDRLVIEGGDLKAPEALSEPVRIRLLQASIFARVSPGQKLDLIELHQRAGGIVAMTGDGVNDAPALRKADIGIAMGLRGSQVARQAADMVLRDDAFGTIVAAVAQGRVIFANIRKFIVYLLSCNLSEIFVVGLASLSGMPLPILPLQILYLNLVTDVFPAFALGAGEGEADVMERQPRDPKEPLLPRRQWVAILAYGASITAATLASFMLSLTLLGLTPDRAVTISFLTLALSQLWHVFNMRNANTRFLRNEITRNRYVWAAIVLCLGLILGAVYIPGLAAILDLSAPTADGWYLAVGLSLGPWAIGQIVKTGLVGKYMAPTRARHSE
jgi:Ca2+-transporting ATPase